MYYFRSDTDLWLYYCEQIFGNELLLANILSALPLKELVNNCLLVNQSWRRIARTIIHNRNQSQHLFELYRIGRHHNINNINRETHLADGNNLSFISTSYEEIEAKLIQEMRHELTVWPHLVLTFYGNFCPHSRRPERLMHYNVLRRYLPSETQFLNVVSSAGLIGSPLATPGTDRTPQAQASGKYFPVETQSQVGNFAGISLLILPKYPNVEIDVFDEKNLIALEKLNSRNDLKCLIVFSTSCDGKNKGLKEFDSINQLRAKYENKIAIGGIISDEITYLANNQNMSRKKSREFYGIAVSGPNVRACSLLFNTYTPETTERKLREFRQNLAFDPTINKCETIAFMFICTGRGIHTEGNDGNEGYNNAPNVEASLFRRVFPDVKLLGVFGQGEFGHNYWPSLTRQRQLELSRELNKGSGCGNELWHFYTSVLIIVNLPKH